MAGAAWISLNTAANRLKTYRERAAWTLHAAGVPVILDPQNRLVYSRVDVDRLVAGRGAQHEEPTGGRRKLAPV